MTLADFLIYHCRFDHCCRRGHSNHVQESRESHALIIIKRNAHRKKERNNWARSAPLAQAHCGLEEMGQQSIK